MNKTLIKFIVIITTIPLLIGLYFFENIKGYYRFKWYCENEGGLKKHENLNKNATWISENKRKSMFIAQQNHIGLSLYKNKRDDFISVIFKGGNPSLNNSYDYIPIEKNIEIDYIYKTTQSFIENTPRLYKNDYKVINHSNNKPMIEFSRYSYSIFDRDNTLLASPSGMGCFELSDFKKTIDNSLKN